MSILSCISATMPSPTRYVITTENFQMIYFMSIVVTNSKSQKLKRRPTLVSKLGNSKIWLWVVLMPLEIKLHTVSYLNSDIRSNETAVWSVYDVKWVLFKLIFCPLKMLACPCPLHCSIPCVRAFKWGTVWHSTSRGIRNTKGLD